jgi:hypothetical protein
LADFLADFFANFLADFRPPPLFAAERLAVFDARPGGGGTFAPVSRASLSAIAIACLRLVTRRPEPLLSVPFFSRCNADSIRFDAAAPYLAIR